MDVPRSVHRAAVPRPVRRTRAPRLFSQAAAAFVAAMLSLPGFAAGFESISPDWSGVSDPFYPLNPATTHNPVISRGNITGLPTSLVADPFLLRVDGTWYMFFEVLSIARDRGRIGLATSQNGVDWHYQHIVLEEAFHLSFPCVFEWNGEFYMVPETGADESVRLYRATAFPDQWSYVATLVSGRVFADPSVFRFANTWWMFVGTSDNNRCYLYASDHLDHGWREHPLSPICVDRGRARPAGRTVVQSGRLVRLAQKCDEYYGEAVRAFEVDLLTRTGYAEHEIPESPILDAAGSGWNRDGMHHCDPWWVDDHWMVAVDGVEDGIWSIGIYRTGEIPVEAEETAPPVFLVASPAPFREQVVFKLPFSGGDRSGRGIEIYSPTGARVRGISGTAGDVLVWDGRDDLGRPAPAGTYLCVDPATRSRLKIVRMR